MALAKSFIACSSGIDSTLNENISLSNAIPISLSVLPTPANALFIMSIPMIEYTGTYEWLVEALYNPFVLLGIAILSAYMLNAEIPLFSLKVKNISWATNKIQVFFLGISLVFLFFLSFTALPVIILFYVLLSVVNNKFLAAK